MSLTHHLTEALKPVSQKLQNNVVHLPSRLGLPLKVIRDDSKIDLNFNVMPDRPVGERFHLKEYRIWNRYAEVTFDREYFSSMEKSPDHLIFLTGLAHCQKILYVYLSHELGFEYDPKGKEVLKYWPTSVHVEMPKMVRQNHDVVQKFWVHKIDWLTDTSAFVSFTTLYNDSVEIKADGKVYLISDAVKKPAFDRFVHAQ